MTRSIEYIVVHHTASSRDATAEEVFESMKKRYGPIVPTHYIVDGKGTVLNVTDVNEPAGGFSDKNGGLTLDEAMNMNWKSIHIEVVGTRVDTENKADMPNEQEKALRELVAQLQQQYPNAELTAHSLIDRNKGSCGQALLRTLLSEPEKEPQWMEISLSRYYSVVPNQTEYYGGRTYEEDFNINCQGDCLITADGHQLKSEEAGLVVACPKEYKLGTRFYVEGLGTVICHDRGGAIVKQGSVIRLDVRSGIGDQGRINIQRNKIRTGKTRGYVLSN